jgi:TatA/E family protein of Tat protein translocase
MLGRIVVKGARTMIGTQDLLIALALGFFFFGAKRLPEAARSLGRALEEFKKGINERPEQQPPASPRENPKAK